MIVLFHMLAHGGKIHRLASDSYEVTDNTTLFLLVFSLLSFAVNCFVFISGYYGIKFKLRTVISFIVQGFFYSIISFIFFKYILAKPEYLGSQTFFKSLFPISYNTWWFLTAYISLYILSPVINKGVDLLSKYQLLMIIILLACLEITYPITGINHLVGAGLGLYPMLIIYLIARFCKKYKQSIKHPLLYCIGISLSLFLISYISLYYGQQKMSWRFFTYASPFVILGAIFLFYIFKNIKIKANPCINKIASLTFGIYLIHEAPGVYLVLKNIVSSMISEITSPFFLIIVLIIIAITVFVICALIEQVRVVLFTPIVDKLNKVISSKIPTLDIKDTV